MAPTELSTSYTAIIHENYEGDWMTDAGYRVSQLEPIHECVLTPGDPSPAGRTPEGDLAYPVHPARESIMVGRDEAALIASLLARELGLTQLPEPPYADPKVRLFNAFLRAAAPDVYFEKSNHGQLEYTRVRNDILHGRLDNLPDYRTRG